MPTKNRLLLLLVAFVLAFTACNKPQNDTLSRKEMTTFLIDLHKLDGALVSKGMGSVDDRNNVYYYNALLKKHGITKAQFDSTLVYYAKNPKKFERVYTDVIEELTEFDEKVKAGIFHPVDSVALRNSIESLWPLPITRYHFAKDSTASKLKFVIKNRQLAWNDQYKLSFLHQVGKSDSIKNKQAVIRIHYRNKKTDSIVCKTISDSLLRRYTITIEARRKNTIDSITGALINYNPAKGKFNALIDSIKITRKFDAIAQDSIQKVIQLIENPPAKVEPVKQTLRLRSKILLQLKNETPK
jgi:DNA-binding transcriptional ArsR family regulator